VEYRVLLEATREHIERHYPRGVWQRFFKRVAIEWILPYPSRLNVALLPARLVHWLGLGRLLPAWMRETVALACQPRARGTLATFHPARGTERRGTVGFVPGCVMSVVFGPTNAASVGLLNRAGYDVKIPRGQGCCGALHLHGGRLEEARAFARRNVAAFGADKLEAIIINAAGCGSALKEYGHLLQDDGIWAERAKEFARRVKDLSEFLASVPHFKNMLAVAPAASGRVAFHDACHLAHAQRIVREPRELVRAVAGEKLVAMPESDVCCGGAGSYFLTEPAMAARLQDRKVDNIVRSGAETIVTTNPGCWMQIRAGLRRRGQGKVRVVHLADYLWERVGGAGEG
jgi:glycolate oxidase iron-sulfur subunit